MSLHDQLERDLDRYPHTDLDRLSTAARRAGGRRVRRRRARLGLAGATATVALIGGALAVTGSGREPSVAADSVAEPTGPSGADVTATPRGIVAALDWAIAQERTGTASGFAGQGGHDYYSELRWTDADGDGASLIGVNVQFRPGATGRCDEPTYVDCTRVTRSDGSTLATFTEFDPVPGGTGLRRVADLIGPDGRRVVVTATNGFDRGGDAEGRPVWDLTRAQPPLTIAQLTDIAEQPFWGHTLPQSFEDAGAELSPYVDLDARTAREWDYG